MRRFMGSRSCNCYNVRERAAHTHKSREGAGRVDDPISTLHICIWFRLGSENKQTEEQLIDTNARLR